MQNNIRVTYSEKYNHISYKWGLSNRKVQELARKYELQLIDEILDDTPLTISPFFMDRRNREEYFFDLLDGRIVEDFIVLWFESKGSVVKKVGSDSDGKIVRDKGKRISTNADLEVDGEDIEVQISRAGKRAKYHIKKGKGNKILRDKNTLMFIVGDSYFMVDWHDIEEASIEVNGAWGGKECYVITDPEYKPLREVTKNE